MSGEGSDVQQQIDRIVSAWMMFDVDRQRGLYTFKNDEQSKRNNHVIMLVLDRGVFRNGFLDVSSVSVGCIPLKMMNNQSVIIM